MDIDVLIVGVFAGNVLTLCVVWAAREFQKYKHREHDAPWLAFAMMLLPTLYALSVFVTADPPQSLDALAALLSGR